jgi:hypothetical protein
MARWIWRVCGIVAALLLPACASGPRLPLLSPIEQAKDYGYAEKPLGDSAYTVSYVGQPRIALSYHPERDQATEAARTQAYDFALWRAALLAEAGGYDGLRVTSRQADVDTVAQPSYSDASFYGPFGPDDDMFHVRHGPDFAYYSPPSPYARIQARARIDVQLIRQPGPGDLTVRDVLGQLQRTYPNADKAPPAG